MTSAPAATPRDSEADLLAAGLIHELRQPLMGVKAGLLLAAAELGDRATRLESWELLSSQVRRIEELFQTWHALLVRPEGPGVAFAVEPVVTSTVELAGFRLRPLGAEFSVAADPALPAAAGSARALVHALGIVLANALDARAAVGRGRLAVRLLAPAPGGGALEVRVSDEGPGVPPQRAARLFERGFTTKPRAGGAGLGLHLARHLMRAAGGDVRLVPEDDARRCPWARAEFAIVLPVAEEAP
jgi:C4-dicarboxylate-specific signal transduction histidine kinase